MSSNKQEKNKPQKHGGKKQGALSSKTVPSGQHSRSGQASNSNSGMQNSSNQQETRQVPTVNNDNWMREAPPPYQAVQQPPPAYNPIPPPASAIQVTQVFYQTLPPFPIQPFQMIPPSFQSPAVAQPQNPFYASMVNVQHPTSNPIQLAGQQFESAASPQQASTWHTNRSGVSSPHSNKTSSMNDDARSVDSSASRTSRGGRRNGSQQARNQQHAGRRNESESAQKYQTQTHLPTGRSQSNVKGGGLAEFNEADSVCSEAASSTTSIRGGINRGQRRGQGRHRAVARSVVSTGGVRQEPSSYPNAAGAFHPDFERGRGNGRLRAGTRGKGRGRGAINNGHQASDGVDLSKLEKTAQHLMSVLRGQRGRGSRWRTKRGGRTVHGSTRTPGQRTYNEKLVTSVDSPVEVVPSVMSPDAEEWDDVTDSTSIVDGASSINVDCSVKPEAVRRNVSSSAAGCGNKRSFHARIRRGRGGARGALIRTIGLARCAAWVANTVSIDVDEPQIENETVTTEELSAAHDSEWVDENVDEIVSAIDTAQVQTKAIAKKRTKRNRGKKLSPSMDKTDLQPLKQNPSPDLSGQKQLGQNQFVNDETQRQPPPQESIVSVPSVLDGSADTDKLAESRKKPSKKKSNKTTNPVVMEENKSCETFNSLAEPVCGVAGREVDENEVLAFIVNRYGAQCRVNQLYDLFKTKNSNVVINRLRTLRRIKVRVSTRDVNQSVAFVLLKGLRLCANISRCKTENNCPHLHLCPKFVTDSCHQGSACQYSHRFDDEHNSAIVSKCGIGEICKDELVLLELVRCCSLIVCQAHNRPESGSGCEDPEVCLKLHVCGKYMTGNCLIPAASCKFGHDEFSERNMAIIGAMELSHLRNKDEKLLRRMVLISDNGVPFKGPVRVNVARSSANRGVNRLNNTERSSERGLQSTASQSAFVTDLIDFAAPEAEQPSVGARSSSVSTMDELTAALDSSLTMQSFWAESKVAEISLCEQFEQHECDDGLSGCCKRHCKESFCWRVNIGKKWIAVDGQAEVEAAYCDPYCSSMGTTIMSHHINIDFENMDSAFGRIQRLTTPSYVICRGNTDATKWRWYWIEGNSNQKVWISYEDDQPPYQDVLESKFQFDRTRMCCFETNDSQYLIDFKEMKQINMKTDFKRKICRRPMSSAAWHSQSNFNFYYVPSKLPVDNVLEWVPMNTERDGWTDLIPIDKHHHKTKAAYQLVVNEFHLTMPTADFEIKAIYRIQNLDLHHKYLSYKTKMERRADSKHTVSSLERRLFHGTDDEQTVRCICHQNFDPRMHGVHGTLYGKGAYFATTSKYSHSYTRPISRTGSRYMFYARVLVGKSVLGDKSYQRPPPLDPKQKHGALYDSCVDNEDNASIFVIFDNDQCYPEFMIEYKDLKPQISLQNYTAPVPPTMVAAAAAAPAATVQSNNPSASISSSSTTTGISGSSSSSGATKKDGGGCSVM